MSTISALKGKKTRINKRAKLRHSTIAALKLKRTLAEAIKGKLVQDNISISTFAKRANTGRNAIRRLLDERNTAITLKTMTQAADTLNLELALTVKQLPLSKLEPILEECIHTEGKDKAAKLEKEFLEGYYGKPIAQLNVQPAKG